MTFDFLRPGRPTDNTLIESFNGSFRDECLNVNCFLSVDDAREKIEVWRKEYISFRPHSSLGDLTPKQLRERHFTIRNSVNLAVQFVGEAHTRKSLLLDGTNSGRDTFTNHALPKSNTHLSIPADEILPIQG